MIRTSLTVLVCALALGCTPDARNALAPGDSAHQEDRVLTGSPEALGMVAFLNDAGTTFELLDDDVGLDRRAAESIIAHRNGPDGVLGWLQDSLFNNIDEVDDCYYVGNTALGKIEDWALDHTWIALDGDDVLGTWDGVTFTVAEAAAVVELSNTAGQDFLDDDIALDSRAVDSIIAARPIDTVAQLSTLYYVGGSALNALKDAAVVDDDCDVDGWDIAYIYDNGDGAWRNELPAGLVGVIDEVVRAKDWCDPVSSNDVWFVKATVDTFNCDEKGYTIELGQEMADYPGSIWYIEFTVDTSFSYEISACEV